ncbi:MAG TPA: N-formylglutamate amidohydrolase [Paracoccaceae bacterium]|nr:N-formylglutamate amidohydrolase [Paracoccaceae bacterium]
MQNESYEVLGETRNSRWLLTCDHASNRVPEWINGGDLGICAEDMSRHIAYDVGAAGVTEALAEVMDAPAVLSRFSRLVIDPNRGEDDPTLLMRLYDGTIIPANRNADRDDLELRLNRLYRPYHAAYAALAAAREDRVICAVHSFTPQLRGRPPRPWQIGILHSHLDTRLAELLIDRLRQETDLCVGDNEPYNGHLPGDAIDRHALKAGRPNVLIEIRNDLIQTPEDQQAWAQRLAPILNEVLEASGL